MSYDNNSDNIYNLLKLTEIAIDESFSLIGQYAVIKKEKIQTLLDRLEQNMPEVILKARSQLIREGKEKIYKNIDEMRNIIDRGFFIFGNYVVIKNSELLILIDEIYANLPVEILEAKTILKS